MYKEFSEKVVLITGGNSGIGKATALEFARNGANVIIVGKNSQKGMDVVSQAKQNGWKVEFMCVDVSIASDVQNMISEIVRRYGHIDIAFNNAGVDGEMGRTANCTIENWQNVINTNLNGTFYCMKYETAEMLNHGSGVIINNISVSGHKGYPGGIAYVSSKHALVGLTKAAAMEYATKQIRVNGISPGIIKTPMTEPDRDRIENYDEWVKKVQPIGREGTAEEVAQAVLWLASSNASFVTGHIMAVDGGILAC